MNKIININLAGRLIPIEEGAFATLHQYVNWLKQYFGREKGGDEIVRDMEDRIGELFQDRLKGGTACITEADVQSVINIMGSPEQIVHEASAEDNTDEAGAAPEPEARRYFEDNGKRLTRSNKEKVIGGVCGGIAAYFHIDPAIVRVIFALVSLTYGIGIVIYGLLWIVLPVSGQTHITGLRRRLFRNPERKVVGGVCSGLAEYFHVDPVILRLVFVLPLLGTIFFGAVDSDIFFFPAFAGGIPTLLLLYIILWASVPEAKTVAEKLEMRGTHVDVQSLSHAIKTEDQKADAGEKIPASAGQGGSPFRVFALLMKILVYIILGFCLLILASVLVGLITALFGIAVSSVYVFPFKSLITDSETIQWVLWISLLVLLIVPFYAIIRLVVRLISGRKYAGNRWIHLTLGVLFFAAILSIISIAGLLANDFRNSYTTDETVAIQQPAGDTVIIRQAAPGKRGLVSLRRWYDDDDLWLKMQNDTTVLINNIRFEIVPSPDSLFHLMAHKSAYGRTVERARTEAEILDFAVVQEGNTIILPADMSLPSRRPFRGQGIRFELQVPAGGVFKTEGMNDDVYDRMHIRVGVNRISYTINEDDAREWKDGVYHTMEIPASYHSRKAAKDKDSAGQSVSY